MTSHEFAKKILDSPDRVLLPSHEIYAQKAFFPNKGGRRGRPPKSRDPSPPPVRKAPEAYLPSPIVDATNVATLRGLMSENKIEFEKLRELVVNRGLVKSQNPIEKVEDFSPDLISMLVKHQAGWIGTLTGKRLLP